MSLISLHLPVKLSQRCGVMKIEKINKLNQLLIEYKLWGAREGGRGEWWGIVVPQECFSLSNYSYELILGHSMNIFEG